MRRMSSTGTLAAPVTARRNVARSWKRASGSLSMDWNTAGGPGSMVMRSSRTRSASEATSNTAWGTIVDPVSTDASTPDFSPAVWKKG